MAFDDLKDRQSVMWGSAPYEPIVKITSELHEALVDALDPQPGQRWLDVATGTGAVAIRAARRGAAVTGVDLAPALISLAEENVTATDLRVQFATGDAEALNFEDASFDVVTSAIGIQFAPDHPAVAAELARVCRPGGRLGLACWTPTSGVADMFAVMKPFMPPTPSGVGNTFDWGRPDYVHQMLGADFDLTIEERDSVLDADSSEQVWETFTTAYGPTKTLVGSLESDERDRLQREWIALFERCRVGTRIKQSRTYLLIVGTRH